jgi:hypothetical protein
VSVFIADYQEQREEHYVILNPFPFLFAKPIHCRSIGQMNYKRTRKDNEKTTSRDSAQKARYQRNASKRLSDDDQACNELGNFLEGQLFERFLDSPTATPSKEFLHSIGENSYSSALFTVLSSLLTRRLVSLLGHSQSRPAHIMCCHTTTPLISTKARRAHVSSADTFAHLGQQTQSVHVRHPHVEDRKSERSLSKQFKRSRR